MKITFFQFVYGFNNGIAGTLLIAGVLTDNADAMNGAFLSYFALFIIACLRFSLKHF